MAILQNKLFDLKFRKAIQRNVEVKLGSFFPSCMFPSGGKILRDKLGVRYISVILEPYRGYGMVTHTK